MTDLSRTLPPGCMEVPDLQFHDSDETSRLLGVLQYHLVPSLSASSRYLSSPRSVLRSPPLSQARGPDLAHWPVAERGVQVARSPAVENQGTQGGPQPKRKQAPSEGSPNPGAPISRSPGRLPWPWVVVRGFVGHHIALSTRSGAAERDFGKVCLRLFPREPRHQLRHRSRSLTCNGALAKCRSLSSLGWLWAEVQRSLPPNAWGLGAQRAVKGMSSECPLVIVSLTHVGTASSKRLVSEWRGLTVSSFPDVVGAVANT